LIVILFLSISVKMYLIRTHFFYYFELLCIEPYAVIQFFLGLKCHLKPCCICENELLTKHYKHIDLGIDLHLYLYLLISF